MNQRHNGEKVVTGTMSDRVRKEARGHAENICRLNQKWCRGKKGEKT